MRRLTPTSLELEKAADALLGSCDPLELHQWQAMRPTRVLFILLEAARMKAFESIEAGPDSEKSLVTFMAQAQLADYLMDELSDYISPREDETDGEHTDDEH